MALATIRFQKSNKVIPAGFVGKEEMYADVRLEDDTQFILNAATPKVYAGIIGGIEASLPESDFRSFLNYSANPNQTVPKNRLRINNAISGITTGYNYDQEHANSVYIEPMLFRKPITYFKWTIHVPYLALAQLGFDEGDTVYILGLLDIEYIKVETK